MRFTLALALTLILLSPVAAMAEAYPPYPGERQVDSAALAVAVAPAIAALDRLYPDAPRCANIEYFSADDLGLTATGRPAVGRGGGCKVWFVSNWLRVALIPDDYSTDDKVNFCGLLVHELGHASLGLPHNSDPNSIMYAQSPLPVLPECAAAFPASIEEVTVSEVVGEVVTPALTFITRAYAKRTVMRRLKGKGWNVRFSVSVWMSNAPKHVVAYEASARKRVCHKGRCKTMRKAFIVEYDSVRRVRVDR